MLDLTREGDCAGWTIARHRRQKDSSAAGCIRAGRQVPDPGLRQAASSADQMRLEVRSDPAAAAESGAALVGRPHGFQSHNPQGALGPHGSQSLKDDPLACRQQRTSAVAQKEGVSPFTGGVSGTLVVCVGHLRFPHKAVKRGRRADRCAALRDLARSVGRSGSRSSWLGQSKSAFRFYCVTTRTVQPRQCADVTGRQLTRTVLAI